MTTRACPSCHTSNPDHNRFCGHCGSKLQAVQTIIYPAEGQGIYTVEYVEPARPAQGAPAPTLAAAASVLAAEAAVATVERLLGPRPIASPYWGQLREGVVGALAGTVLLFAERQVAGRSLR